MDSIHGDGTRGACCHQDELSLAGTLTGTTTVTLHA